RCASTVDSTKPASRSTRRCFDTVGWGIRSRRSISPTDCCDETRRLSIARRFGSAMMSNTDSTLNAYFAGYMRVKVYIGSYSVRIAANPEVSGSCVLPAPEFQRKHTQKKAGQHNLQSERDRNHRWDHLPQDLRRIKVAEIQRLPMRHGPQRQGNPQKHQAASDRQSPFKREKAGQFRQQRISRQEPFSNGKHFREDGEQRRLEPHPEQHGAIQQRVNVEFHMPDRKRSCEQSPAKQRAE